MLLVTRWQHPVPGAGSKHPPFFLHFPSAFTPQLWSATELTEGFFSAFFCGQTRILPLCNQSITSAVSTEHSNTAKEAQNTGKQLSNGFHFKIKPEDWGHSLSKISIQILPTVLPKQQSFLLLLFLLSLALPCLPYLSPFPFPFPFSFIKLLPPDNNEVENYQLLMLQRTDTQLRNYLHHMTRNFLHHMNLGFYDEC